MLRIQLCSSQYAGMLLCPVLLAATLYAQQMVRPAEPPQSILSLAPAPRPQGDLLARRPSDARFEHAPANYHVFAAATAGQDAGVEALTVNFAGSTTLTGIKSKNKDFVVEPGGTCVEGDSYARGQSCTLLVRFNPQGPGHRLGFLNITHTAEAEPMTFGFTGNGRAPVVSFTPSQITTVPGTAPSGTGLINDAYSLAIDGSDAVYIADFGNDLVREIDSSGTISNLNPTSAAPQWLAVDSFGVVYTLNALGSTNYFSIIYPWGFVGNYGYPYLAYKCTMNAPCTLAAVGMDYPAFLSIDAQDDLYFEEAGQFVATMPVAGVAQGTATLNVGYLNDDFAYVLEFPESFAVNAIGNLYNYFLDTSETETACLVVEEDLDDAAFFTAVPANRVAGGEKCGFSGDGGQASDAEISDFVGQIAFDIAGNLYFTDTDNQRVRRIDALTGIISTIAGNGTAGYAGDGGAATTATLSNPTGVAVDSQGQVYILSNAPTAGPTQALRKVGVNGAWSYGHVLKGTTSPTKVFIVANTGNDTLTLAANASLIGADPADFSIDPTTTTCGLVAGATLQALHSCRIGIAFKPSAGGVRSATLLLLDNTVSGANTILLDGAGSLPAPTMTVTSPAGSSVTEGTTVTFAVSVTSTSSTKPTGTVTFEVNGNPFGSPVTLSTSGTASTTFSESKAATYTLSAVYSGDTNYSSATQTESLIVTAVRTPVKVSLAPAADPASACGAVSFSVQVSSVAGGSPTGTVELKSGAASLASASLTSGAAVLSTSALSAGTRTFVAAYSGDSLHEPAVSAPISLSPGASCTAGHPPAATSRGIVR